VDGRRPCRFPSTWAWQKIAARIGLYAANALACFIEVIGVTASVALGGYWGPLLGGLLLGGTFIAVTALGLQAARQQAPRRRGASLPYDGIIRPWPDHRPDRRRTSGSGIRQFLPRFDHRGGHAGRLRRHYMVGRAKIAMICGLAWRWASGRHFLSP